MVWSFQTDAGQWQSRKQRESEYWQTLRMNSIKSNPNYRKSCTSVPQDCHSNSEFATSALLKQRRSAKCRCPTPNYANFPAQVYTTRDHTKRNPHSKAGKKEKRKKKKQRK